MGRKPKRKLTAAEKAAKWKRREETMTIFVNGKQKRVNRLPTIDGMDHDSVVKQWRQNAKRNDDENYDFLRSMKFEEYGFEPDELAANLHKEIFEIIDCTRCANCCKTMRLGLNGDDINRIASISGCR